VSSAERIQKLLARAGYGSRREIERWIEQGLVAVNGRTARLGDVASPDDRLSLRGQPIVLERVRRFKPRVIAYHKPEGEVCTAHDPEGRPTIFRNLPRMRTSRWISVGRLDINTSGLLLLTNDGELANRMMHPSYGLERQYMSRILGEVDEAMLARLRAGVELDDGQARFDELVPGGGSGANRWFRVSLREGRRREVRRLWESQGVRVSRLSRVRYGPVRLDRSLRPGRWRELRPEELAAVYRSVGLEPPTGSGREPREPRRRGRSRAARR
jgi:23S rRNA pseudouridine2605 synthase